MAIGYLFKEDVKQHRIKGFIFYLFAREWLLAIRLKKVWNNSGLRTLYFICLCVKIASDSHNTRYGGVKQELQDLKKDVSS